MNRFADIVNIAMHSELTYVFIIALSLTLLFSFFGDDDVVYKFMGRKPTPQEGLARIRFVLAKAFAAMSGGALVVGTFGAYTFHDLLHVQPSKNQLVLIALVCMGLVVLLIAGLQNIIRYLLGRQIRPLVDISLMRSNLAKWLNFFKGQQ